MRYSNWDYYEIADGFRIYRDVLGTGDGIRHVEYGEVCKTRTDASEMCCKLNGGA